MPFFRAITKVRRSRTKETTPNTLKTHSKKSPDKDKDTKKPNIFSKVWSKLRKTRNKYSESKGRSKSRSAKSERSRSAKSRTPDKSITSINDIIVNPRVNFNAPYSPKSTKCSSGKEAKFLSKTDKFHISRSKIDYLEEVEYKNALDCPDELPHVKYEKDINRFCCAKTMVTKQELFDYINTEITKFVEKYSKDEIGKSDSLQILISKLLERRNILLKWMMRAKEYDKSSLASIKEDLQKQIGSAERSIRDHEKTITKWIDANKDRPVDPDAKENPRNYLYNLRIASRKEDISDLKKKISDLKRTMNEAEQIEKHLNLEDRFIKKIHSPEREAPFSSLDEWVEYMGIDRNASRSIIFKTMSQTSSNFNIPLGTSFGEDGEPLETEDSDEVDERRRSHIEKTLGRVNKK